MQPSCPLNTRTFVDSRRSPCFSLAHFKEKPPHPSKKNSHSPFLLMADRLWPHSLTTAACPHCVPLSEREACGWKTDSLSKVNAWRGWISPNWTIIHLQLPAATCILLRESEKKKTGRERGMDWEYLWHSDACLTLEEANHRIEVLGMMGDGLSESGGGGERGCAERRGGGCFKCKSLSYKNWFHLKGFLGNDPHFHGRGDSEQEKTA